VAKEKLMLHRLVPCVVAFLIVVSGVSAQTASQPFASVDQAVKAQRGGWVGEKSQVSALFAAERRKLGARFEAELIKWLGKDIEKHYWISLFLEDNSYLHGNKRLPHLSLLLMEQGISLAREQADVESQGYVVSFNILAAVLSDELGFSSLAISHKDEAEGMLKITPALKAHVPAMYDADRARYDRIPTNVDRPEVTVVETGPDSNPPPKARISWGVLNGRALHLARPPYSVELRNANASGEVEVSVVFDEQGKVIWARALSGHRLLRTHAEQAALQSTFPPTKLSGEPVKVRGVIIYNFVP
jgi:hypothetical protein